MEEGARTLDLMQAHTNSRTRLVMARHLYEYRNTDRDAQRENNN
jgi:hypothetical protein